MAKRTFMKDGNKYDSMSAIAKELGIKRLYPRDFAKYGVTEITDAEVEEEQKQDVAEVEDASEEVSEAVEETTDVVENDDEAKVDEVAVEESDDEESEDTAEVEKPAEQPKSEKDTPKDKPAKVAKKTYTIEELVKMPLADFSKYLRKVDTDDIVTFAENNQLETFADMDDKRIRRMKVVMVIKDKFFPGQALPVKKSSFKGVDVDQLTAFADENNVEYKKATEPKIQKMWVIYALNQAGFYELPQAAAAGDVAEEK